MVGASTGATGTGTVGNTVGTGSRDLQYYAANVGFLSAFEIDLFGRVRNLSKAALEQYLATEEAQRSLRTA